MKNNGIDVVVIAYIVSQFKLIIDIINKYYIQYGKYKNLPYKDRQKKVGKILKLGVAYLSSLYYNSYTVVRSDCLLVSKHQIKSMFVDNRFRIKM